MDCDSIAAMMLMVSYRTYDKKFWIDSRGSFGGKKKRWDAWSRCTTGSGWKRRRGESEALVGLA